MTTLKLINVGNSVGVILPKEMLAKLNLKKGDALYATDIPDGFAVRAYDPVFAEQMEAAEIIMRENRDALRMLAQ